MEEEDSGVESDRWIVTDGSRATSDLAMALPAFGPLESAAAAFRAHDAGPKR